WGQSGDGQSILVTDAHLPRRVGDGHVIRDQGTIGLRPRRGLTLCGSNNHRILANNPVTWRRLDELAVGERVAIAGGAGLWPKEPVPVRWQPPRRMTLEDVAEQSDATLNQVSSYLYRSGLSTA